MKKGQVYLEINRFLIAGEYSKAKKILDRDREGMAELVYLECLANLAFYQDDWSNAIEQYQVILAKDYSYPIARYSYIYGLQCEKQGNLEEAVEHLTSAIEYDPEFIDAYLELGVILANLGELKGALACYQDGLKNIKNDFRIYENIKLIFEELIMKYPNVYEEEYKIFLFETYDKVKSTLTKE